MRLPFFGGSYKGASTEANPQECINYLPELDNEGGLHSFVIRPGLTEVADLSEEDLQAEIITNGSFAVGTSWTLGDQWSIGGGTLTRTAGTADTASQLTGAMVSALVEGVTYRLTFTVSGYSGGYMVPSVGETNGTAINANGDYSMDVVSGSGTSFIMTASTQFAASIDDVSLKELIIPDTEMRGIRIMGQFIYAVHGDQLKRLDSNFENESTLTTSTNKLSTNSGPVTMAHNFNQDGGLQLMICDGTLGVGYIYDTDTEVFTRISEDEHEFFGGGTVAAQDGYFISNRPGTHEFYTSAVNDGLTWDSLDVTTAEAKTSPLSRMISAYQNLWAFKGDSTEQFYNSGQEPLFQRTSLALIELGLAAVHSLALLDNAILWLADDRTVRLSRGGASANVVSTYHIARVIEKLTIISDAIGIGFMFNNHALYLLTFPFDEKTLVYDISNNIWSEWKSYKEDGVQDDGRFRANCHTEFNGEDIIGDYRNNRLYKIDQSVYADDGQRMRRVRVFRGPKEEDYPMFMHEFELDLDSGVGLDTGQGSDPQAMLQVSRDGGRTYGSEIWTSIGKRGNYSVRAIWRRLGRARNPVFKVTISDPIPDVLVGAYLDVEKGYN